MAEKVDFDRLDKLAAETRQLVYGKEGWALDTAIELIVALRGLIDEVVVSTGYDREKDVESTAQEIVNGIRLFADNFSVELIADELRRVPSDR